MKDGVFQKEEYLEFLKNNFFLAPDSHNLDNLIGMLAAAIKAVVENQGNKATYQRFESKKSTSDIISDATIPENPEANPIEYLVNMLPRSLQGGVIASNPSMLKNVVSLPSFVYLAANTAASLYVQNGVTGEDSAEALNSEIKISAAMAELANYNKSKAAGLSTFGGTATNMYAFKIGMSKCSPEHIVTGIRKDIFVIGSKPAHYSHLSSAIWLGMGQNNYVQVRSHTDQTSDLEDMELKCRETIEKGGLLACIVGAGGTTSNMGIDDFAKIKQMRDKLVKDYNLNYIPHIHADSVIGWP